MSAAAVSDESYSSHQIEFEFEMPCRRDANIHIVAGSLPTRLTVSPERLAILWAVHDVESEFEHISQLGIGQFGQVSLMRRVKTDEICAVKRVHHQPTLQRSRLQSERACLRALSHPFIVQCYGTFTDESSMYFFLEFLAGGELFNRIQTAKRGSGKRGLKPSHVRFYAAEITLALEYIHSCNVIYRDLKPENIMLDVKGHVRLVDFGLAMQMQTARCYSIVGTTEYLAPELILGHGSNVAADWWALGVLIFEMLVGVPPFRGNNKLTTCNNIVRDPVDFPPLWPTRSGRSLVRALLNKDPLKRLGGSVLHKKQGAVQIKEHEFFDGIDWHACAHRHLEPPWIPMVEHNSDSKYFSNTSESDTYTASSGELLQDF